MASRARYSQQIGERPHYALILEVLLGAVDDAGSGDTEAAAWLEACGSLFIKGLGLDVDPDAMIDWVRTLRRDWTGKHDPAVRH